MKIGKIEVNANVNITEEVLAIVQNNWERAENTAPPKPLVNSPEKIVYQAAPAPQIEEKRFNHPDRELDTNPSRGMNITPHHSPLSTASASYFRD